MSLVSTEENDFRASLTSENGANRISEGGGKIYPSMVMMLFVGKMTPFGGKKVLRRSKQSGITPTRMSLRTLEEKELGLKSSKMALEKKKKAQIYINTCTE